MLRERRCLWTDTAGPIARRGSQYRPHRLAGAGAAVGDAPVVGQGGDEEAAAGLGLGFGFRGGGGDGSAFRAGVGDLHAKPPADSLGGQPDVDVPAGHPPVPCRARTARCLRGDAVAQPVDLVPATRTARWSCSLRWPHRRERARRGSVSSDTSSSTVALLASAGTVSDGRTAVIPAFLPSWRDQPHQHGDGRLRVHAQRTLDPPFSRGQWHSLVGLLLIRACGDAPGAWTVTDPVDAGGTNFAAGPATVV